MSFNSFKEILKKQSKVIDSFSFTKETCRIVNKKDNYFYVFLIISNIPVASKFLLS